MPRSGLSGNASLAVAGVGEEQCKFRIGTDFFELETRKVGELTGGDCPQ